MPDTRRVVGQLFTPTGEPWEKGAAVRFLFTGTFTATAQFPRRAITALLDEEGRFAVDLIVNEVGEVASTFICRYPEPSKETFPFVLEAGDGSEIDIGELRLFGVPEGSAEYTTIRDYILANVATGPSGTITLGTVETGDADSEVVITNTGTPEAAVFNFLIPRGATGPAGTVTVGTVTALAAGSTPVVEAAGTPSAQILNFGIPAGAAGQDGQDGAAPDYKLTIVTVTGTTHTLTAEQVNSRTLLDFTSNSAITLTIPTNAAVPIDVGHSVIVQVVGTGQLSVVAADGTVTIQALRTKTAGQYSPLTLLKKATNVWTVIGDAST